MCLLSAISKRTRPPASRLEPKETRISDSEGQPLLCSRYRPRAVGQGELGDESSPCLLYAAIMALSTAPADGHRALPNQSATGKAEESQEYNQAGSTSGPRGGLCNPAPADDLGSLGRGASAAEITEPERRIPAIPLTAGKWGLILSSPAASATGPATQPEQHIAGKQRHAPVAQLDRASDYGSEGCTFDSCRVYQPKDRLQSQSGGGLRFRAWRH